MLENLDGIMVIGLDKIKKRCRVCMNKTEPFMSFGEMPIANNLINKDDSSMKNNEFNISWFSFY